MNPHDTGLRFSPPLTWIKTEFESLLQQERNDGNYNVIGHVFYCFVTIWRGRIMLGPKAKGFGPFPTWRPPGTTFGAPGPKPPTTRSAPQQDQEQDNAA